MDTENTDMAMHLSDTGSITRLELIRMGKETTTRVNGHNALFEEVDH